jgi:hypothetical protein
VLLLFIWFLRVGLQPWDEDNKMTKIQPGAADDYCVSGENKNSFLHHGVMVKK